MSSLVGQPEPNEPHDLPDTLEGIERELRDKHEVMLRGLNLSQAEQVRIGWLLIRAERSFPKSGEFMAWCKRIFPKSHSQLNRYLAKARHPEKLKPIKSSHDYFRQVCEVMRKADWHTYQVLTKRSERMCDLLNGSLLEFTGLSNVWWGVSVEDRRFGLPRNDHLRQVQGAKLRWLSIEPLLEDLGRFSLEGISWVVVGGESGHGARPMDAEWVRHIRSQCDDQGVPFFFKQWDGVFKKWTSPRMVDTQLRVYNHPGRSSNGSNATYLHP